MYPIFKNPVSEKTTDCGEVYDHGGLSPVDHYCTLGLGHTDAHKCAWCGVRL